MQADWINLTGAETAPNIAEITVFDDRVEVNLEVYVNDLAIFRELVPDGWLKEGEVGRPSIEERLRHFSGETLQFVTETGEKLQAELRVAEPRLRKDRFSPFAGMVNPYTRQRVSEAPQDKRVLYAELVYPFGEAQPKSLTIIPPVDDEDRARATIGFIVYHKSVPVIDFRYLGAASTLTLDADPWYSKFDNPNLKRHHKIALMSFLYVEPYEVRHEILTRVKDLSEWMDLGLRGDRYIELDELEPLKQRIGEFLLHKNPLTVDGKALKPILDRTNYVKVGLSGIRILEKPERLEIASTIIGVIISYITDGMPREVSVDWELFTDQIQRIPATATDPAGPLPTFLTPEDNLHTWTNYLKNYKLPTVQQIDVAGSLGELRIPLITLLCLGGVLVVTIWTLLRARRRKPLRVPLFVAALLLATGAAAYPFASITITRPTLMAGEIDDKQAEALLQTLLKNVYRAFDFREEEDVYDKLALSVSGDLLSEIYLQNRRSMAIQQAGGAQAKVKAVAVGKVSAERVGGDGLGYALHGRWTALGRVGHWGHVHQRKNRYEAVITIAAQEGVWKITGLELMDEQRIDLTPGKDVSKASAEAASTPLSGTQ
ncbi:MAG: hypothetical protein U9Q75_01710 [Pseudomonadota bacterium]|nr:hypothetical protein [Pseudomonadota bacterium]